MSTPIEPVQTFKILIIGDSGVGKSSMMNRVVHGVFQNKYLATIGVDFKIATVKIGEYTCRLQIWDTAGQERFRSVTNSYYRGADGVVIVYDVTNNDSFNSVRSRFAELEFYCDSTVPKMLVGNKDDENNQMDKVVLTRYGQELAKQNNLLFFETSVKDNKNIPELFQKLAKLALQRRLEQSNLERNTVVIQRRPSLVQKTTRRFCVI